MSYYHLDSSNRAISLNDTLRDPNGHFWTVNACRFGKVELALLNRPTTRLIMPVEHLSNYSITGTRSGSDLIKGNA